MKKPIIAITMGDPAGIGPEIIVKISNNLEIFNRCNPLVIGDKRILERAKSYTNLKELRITTIEDPDIGQYSSGRITLLDLHNAHPDKISPGILSGIAGRAAADYVNKACDLAMEGKVDAIVTAPINKEALRLGGIPFPGHTELLQQRSGAKKVGMLLIGGNLRVIHVSTHVSLEEAVKRVKSERVETVIELAVQSCMSMGLKSPRVGVAGLNPHAGEGGLFGDQELIEITPAIMNSRKKGYDVFGPIPPDTIFLRANNGEFDIVVAMYHDQGHIPLKLLAFDKGVNVSLGLPFIRTSVDHGTAFDIAGSGVANANSLMAALDLAIILVNNKMEELR